MKVVGPLKSVRAGVNSMFFDTALISVYCCQTFYLPFPPQSLGHKVGPSSTNYYSSNYVLFLLLWFERHMYGDYIIYTLNDDFTNESMWI